MDLPDGEWLRLTAKNLLLMTSGSQDTATGSQDRATGSQDTVVKMAAQKSTRACPTPISTDS